MSWPRARYDILLYAGLILFGLTLPLSKSAGNVLLFLLYPVAAAGFFLNYDLKQSLAASIRQPLLLVFSLYLLVAFIGVLFTQSYADGLHVANKFFSLPAIYLMASALIDSIADGEARRTNAENILLAFLIGLAALNIIAFLTYFGIVGQKKLALPLAPMSVHHIWFSNINAIGLYVAAAFWLYSPRRVSNRFKQLLIASCAVGILCILLSLSRTAWFGFALTAVIMGFLVSRNKKLFFGVTAGAAAASIALYFIVPLVHDRINLIAQDISRFAAGDTDSSLGARFLMWKAAIMMFLSNPLVGVGTGGYGPTMAAFIQNGKFPQFLLEFNQPHNMYLFALATNGIPGLIVLLSIFWVSLKYSLAGLKKGNNEQKLFAFLGAATAIHFMIAGMTDSFFNIQMLRYTFVFIMGVCARKTLIGPSA